MRFREFVIFALTSVVFCSLGIAQTPTGVDAEKAKKDKETEERVVQMLDQSIAEAEALRLPQNRAVVFAITGDLYWKFDQKRSRELFRNTGAEILNYNAEAEKEKSESTDAYYQPDFGDPNDVRNEVLPLIAARDAELALELLVQTRPSSLAQAMARVTQAVSTDSDMGTFNPEARRVSQEIALEQRFALLAADNSPETAIRVLRESIAKGVSTSVMSLLQKLHRKDAKKAAELGGEVIRKITDSDLANKQEDFRSALTFLQFASRPVPAASSEKAFSFSDAQIKELANKLADALLQPAKSMAAGNNLTSALPTLEKIIPEKVPLLKQRAAENKKNLPAEFKRMQRQQEMWRPNATPEELLAQLSKMQNEMDKMRALQFLSAKIGQITDEARARRLIDQIPDAKMRASALERFESSRIARASSAGNVDEARRMIAAMDNKKIQIQRLVSLALQLKNKGGKNIETAGSIMADAKALANEFPEDEDDIANLMEVVKGYSAIEPDIAFRLFETVIEPFNDIVQASAVLSKYNKRDRAFRKGELVMRVNGSGGGLLPFRYVQHIQMLGKADLDKMSMLSNRFGRSDSRTIIRLYILQGFLKENRNQGSGGVSMGTFTISN